MANKKDNKETTGHAEDHEAPKKDTPETLRLKAGQFRRGGNKFEAMRLEKLADEMEGKSA